MYENKNGTEDIVFGTEHCDGSAVVIEAEKVRVALAVRVTVLLLSDREKNDFSPTSVRTPLP